MCASRVYARIDWWKEAEVIVTPTIPWIGLLLACWLWYRSKRRKTARLVPENRASPRCARALLIQKRAKIVYFLFGGLGIALYVFEYPSRYWVLPALLAIGAYAFGMVQEFVIVSEEKRL